MDVVDIFDPYNQDHIEAYRELEKTGSWDTSKLSDQKLSDPRPNWQMLLMAKMAKAWLAYRPHTKFTGPLHLEYARQTGRTTRMLKHVLETALKELEKVIVVFHNENIMKHTADQFLYLVAQHRAVIEFETTQCSEGIVVDISSDYPRSDSRVLFTTIRHRRYDPKPTSEVEADTFFDHCVVEALLPRMVDDLRRFE